MSTLCLLLGRFQGVGEMWKQDKIPRPLGWWNSKCPITRVELRLGRAALKEFGVDSVEDLLKRERAIVDTVTLDRFRLLEQPKVAGMGKKARIHPLWERVRGLFFRYFTGDEISELTPRQSDFLSCDPTPLLQQIVGCLAKAYVLQYGKPISPTDVITYVRSLGEVEKDKLFRRAVQIADDLIISTGIPFGSGVGFSEIWQQKACDTPGSATGEATTSGQTGASNVKAPAGGTASPSKPDQGDSGIASGSTIKATIPKRGYAAPEPAYDEKGKYPEADDF